MDFDKGIQLFDSTFGSCSRPAIAVMCGGAIAVSCFIPASSPVAIPAATTIVLAYIGARATENIKKANADATVAVANSSGNTSTVDVKAP